MKFANVALTVLSIFTCVAPSLAQTNEYLVWDPSQPRASLVHKASRMTWGSSIEDRRVQIYIDINTRVQRLHVIIDGVQVPDKDGKLDWKISSGLGRSTPIGTFSLDNRWRSAWSNKYKSNMPFAQFISGGLIGMHGTTAVGLLGRAASHGCIRLHTKNAERLYRMVETVLLQDCAFAGIAPALCPLTDLKFKMNPSQNIGVTLYNSGNTDTMYGMSPNLPWLSRRNPAPAPRMIEPPPPQVSREEIERADAEDRAYEEEERRRTQELNRQMNEQYIRERNQSYNSPGTIS